MNAIIERVLEAAHRIPPEQSAMDRTILMLAGIACIFLGIAAVGAIAQMVVWSREHWRN